MSPFNVHVAFNLTSVGHKAGIKETCLENPTYFTAAAANLDHKWRQLSS